MVARWRNVILHLLGRRRLIHALGRFDEGLLGADQDLPGCCGRLLDDMGIRYAVDAPAPPPGSSLLVYAHRTGWLDGFLLPLVCAGLPTRNVRCFRSLSLLAGPRCATRACLLVTGNSRVTGRLETYCWRAYWWKVGLRLLDMLIPPGNLPHGNRDQVEGNVDACLWHLREGGSLTLFPAEVAGEARWGEVLGMLVRDYLLRRQGYRKPVLLCPVAVAGSPPGLSRLGRRWPREATIRIQPHFLSPEALLPFENIEAMAPAAIAGVLSVHYFNVLRTDLLTEQARYKWFLSESKPAEAPRRRAAASGA